MTKHAHPFDVRWKPTLGDIMRRLRQVEQRTMGIDTGFPLMALPAVIDPGYVSGDPKVLINGATVLSGPYQHLASYTPVAGDSVIVLPVVSMQTYIVLGRVT